MKTGTKSILFGVHCFLLHTVFVAIAWIKLYGFPFDPRIWIAFFVHDLGYIGKHDMDGVQGETHPERGAKIMHLFDGWDYIDVTYSDDDIVVKQQAINSRQQEGWIIADVIEMETCCNILFKKRKYKWYDFALCHSRFYARKQGKQFSKLCVADKLAFVITPRWLYIPLATASGEIKEYIQRAMGNMSQAFYDSYIKFHPGIKISWHILATKETRKWIQDHKAGQIDTTTPIDRYKPDLNNRYFVSVDPCSENGCEWSESVEIRPIRGNPVKIILHKN